MGERASKRAARKQAGKANEGATAHHATYTQDIPNSTCTGDVAHAL